LNHWLCLWQGRHPARLDRPRISVFAGNHGVAARGCLSLSRGSDPQMVANFTAGGAAVNQLCLAADAELRVYEMELENPTADFSAGEAMSEADCAKAFAYGMLAAEPGIDLLGLGEMGIANTTSAAALCCALFGGGAREWAGPGTGVVGEALARKITVVDEAMKLHRPQFIDSFDIMRRVGGRELAAIAGAIMAARLAHVPVLSGTRTSHSHLQAGSCQLGPQWNHGRQFQWTSLSDSQKPKDTMHFSWWLIEPRNRHT